MELARPVIDEGADVDQAGFGQFERLEDQAGGDDNEGRRAVLWKLGDEIRLLLQSRHLDALFRDRHGFTRQIASREHRGVGLCCGREDVEVYAQLWQDEGKFRRREHCRVVATDKAQLATRFVANVVAKD